MARKARVQFEGAVYHVMERGDRRESIFRDDEDRKRFIDTLGESCTRTGWRVHAFVLMGNHYHLLLETPHANLVDGMKWFQRFEPQAVLAEMGFEAAIGAVANVWDVTPLEIIGSEVIPAVCGFLREVRQALDA